ncbi:hypothetical protein OC846_005125, partial [Tilletia horrida]
MKKLSKAKQEQIESELRKGRSSRAIAVMHGVSKSAVNRLKQDLENVPPGSPGGRPAKLGERDKNLLKRTVASGSCDNSRQALAELRANGGPAVSVSTVQRALHEKGLKAVVKQKKPMLTARHRQAR